MSDLADQIDDYICTFDGVGDLTMDTLAMLIFAWAVLALFLLWLCKFLYNKYVKKGDSISSGTIDSSKYGTSTSEKLRKSEPKELLASKDIKGLDLAAKPLSKVGVSTSQSTTARKRLSRKSPGPELRKTLRSIPPPTNVVGPETLSVTWTSQVFRWLYSDLVIVNELLQSWVNALNSHTRKSLEENGVDIEIVRVLPESPSPNLANIYCNSTDTNPSEMTITLDCDATPVFQIKAHRVKAGKMETAHYKATVSRFRARLNIKISYNTLKGEMSIEGYPDIRIALNSIGAIKTIDQNERQLQDSISEILSNAIRLCVYPIDFSIYATCPRSLEQESRDLNYGLDFLTNPASSSPLRGVSSGRRLLVKVVKGEGLVFAKDPYCIIEMDEPQQKNQTGARQGSNPYWDEHFLFDLSPQSAEILIEVYDRNPTGVDAPPKFLGLGLVGIDELQVGPSSSQILALQPRPYESDEVQGAITVEFVFIDGAEVPAGRRPYKIKEALKINSVQQLNGVSNGNDLADTAIRALEGGALTYNGNPSKSTLIIHSVQRNQNKDRPYTYRVELNDKGQIEMEESFNESANLTASTDTTDNVDVTFSGNDADAEPTASVLSIDDKENGDIYRDHLINNHNLLNNNVIDNTNKLNDDSGVIESIAENDAHDKINESLKLDNDTDKHNGLLNNTSNDADQAPGEPVAQSSPLTYTNNSYQNGNGTYGSTLDRNNTTTESETNDDRGRNRKNATSLVHLNAVWDDQRVAPNLLNVAWYQSMQTIQMVSD